MRRTAQHIIEIGRDVIAVETRTGHGNFLPWIEAESGMSRQTAGDFVHVAARFGDTLPSLRNLSTIVSMRSRHPRAIRWFHLITICSSNDSLAGPRSTRH